MSGRHIRSVEDVLTLMDGLFEAPRWGDFYADRERPIPFLSSSAIEWARERTADVRFLCFHHLPPHRRISYLALLNRCLKPGGHLGLACFAAGAMGSETPDEDLYSRAGLEGGLAYRPEALRWIFADLTEVELRRMAEEPPDSPRYGTPFLWTALFQRPR